MVSKVASQKCQRKRVPNYFSEESVNGLMYIQYTYIKYYEHFNFIESHEQEYSFKESWSDNPYSKSS